jgi:hypothetical protein
MMAAHSEPGQTDTPYLRIYLLRGFRRKSTLRPNPNQLYETQDNNSNRIHRCGGHGFRSGLFIRL